MSIVFAVIFALIGANITALAAILQRRATGQVHRRHLFHSRLVKSAFKNRLWLAGAGLEIAGFFAQAAALHFGSLALVEPLLITDVVFLLLFLHFGFKSRVGKQGFIGAGPLAITQPALEITEALAGVLMGVLLFGDHINANTGALAAEAIGGLIAATGIVLLGRSTNLHKISNQISKVSL